jgi:dienelactone hydrolase
MRFLGLLIISLFITLPLINKVAAQHAPLTRLSTGPQSTGAQGHEGDFFREQAYHIPLKGVAGQRVAVLVYRPIGETARPLLVMTHGTALSSEKNKEWRIGFFPHAIAFFIQQGYVVALVHRRGYGLTGGEPSEGFACATPNHLRASHNASVDLLSSVDYLTRLPFVKEKGVILIGQSTGGWSVLGAGAHNNPKIAATINFAGGRRGISHVDKSSCGLEELVRDAAVLGKLSKTPSLWIYTKNDQTFSEEVILRLHAAYANGGAPVQFHLLEGFSRDGHSLFPNPYGLPLWRGLVQQFLGAFK